MPPELPPDLVLPPAVVRASTVQVPEAPPSWEGSEMRSIVSSTSTVNQDEEYSADERLLNEFTKMHPMLS